MAAGEAGSVPHHAAGRSPQCGQPPPVRVPSLPPSRSLLLPRAPGHRSSHGPSGTSPTTEQVWALLMGQSWSRSCPSTYVLRLIFPRWAQRQDPLSILFSISQGRGGSKNKRVRRLVITLSSLSTEEQMVRNLLSGTPQIANIPSRMRRSFTCRHPRRSEGRISLRDPQQPCSLRLPVPLHREFPLSEAWPNFALPASFSSDLDQEVTYLK